eukprot:CAMPEP_0117047928 /NCGR_PEP_ID=MMETSP0472-20121206/33104_1 /TAXON_ID=693140 ORGANISM="Tiarina fusus, Strain LIS" /NCGR_SAMPLE_ID=MMETSP0472 /ASSEMBLY_ACC=CAM_ASM_000603 /LENGTH=84 /DNA_ID=CAMNT_0004760779 /DNA_START=6 /DNA_END=260 /DNA_ORIENTATION=+
MTKFGYGHAFNGRNCQNWTTQQSQAGADFIERINTAGGWSWGSGHCPKSEYPNRVPIDRSLVGTNVPKSWGHITSQYNAAGWSA